MSPWLHILQLPLWPLKLGLNLLSKMSPFINHFKVVTKGVQLWSGSTQDTSITTQILNKGCIRSTKGSICPQGKSKRAYVTDKIITEPCGSNEQQDPCGQKCRVVIFPFWLSTVGKKRRKKFLYSRIIHKARIWNLLNKNTKRLSLWCVQANNGVVHHVL